MTEEKNPRRRSRAEVETLLAENGIERMVQADRESGVWSLTFVAGKPEPENESDGSAPSD